jgi:pyridoxine kinase
MARILAISSHVARGTVGLGLTVPALQARGHEVWPLPTIILASRPGLGHFAKHEVPASELEKMLAALEADGCWTMLDAVSTGYFPSRHAVDVAAQAIAGIRAVNPRVEVLVDPILGDDGRLYIAEDTATAIRDHLMPLASIATPNLFELQWLAGISSAAPEDLAAAARRLGPPIVAVTSARETHESVTTLLITPSETMEQSQVARADLPNGAGDLFAGLLLGHMLNGRAAPDALAATIEDLDPILGASQGESVMQLALLRTGR